MKDEKTYKYLNPKDYGITILNPYKFTYKQCLNDKQFLYITDDKNMLCQHSSIARFIEDALKYQNTVNDVLNYIHNNQEFLGEEIYSELYAIVVLGFSYKKVKERGNKNGNN